MRHKIIAELWGLEEATDIIDLDYCTTHEHWYLSACEACARLNTRAIQAYAVASEQGLAIKARRDAHRS